MATIYSTKTGDTITAGLDSMSRSDQAVNSARRIARENNETVILDDEDQGEMLVGPRGGVKPFTPALKRKMGF